MNSIPDVHVFVSWPFVFVKTGNCKENNQDLIITNNKEFQVEVCIFITV